MSGWYRRVRDGIVAGGDTRDAAPPSSHATGDAAGDARADRGPARIGAAVILALVAWLGISNPWTLVFVAGLVISVFLHEVGHFVTARWAGMKVTQFYMGFGPRIWWRRRGEVEFGVRVLPVGAFVRIVGMNNLDECDPADEPRAYRAQSYPKRMLVITAGSLMHLVIALVLFAGVYATAGRLEDTGRVRLVAPPVAGSPAEAIGLREGDVILAVGDAAVASQRELVEAITAFAPGDRVVVSVLRDSQRLTVPAVLGASPVDASVAFLGVGTDSWDVRRLDPLRAVGAGAADVGRTAVQSVGGVLTVLNPLNILRSVTDDDADPATRPTTVVGASRLGGELGREIGLEGPLVLLAAVNVFVGVFNMFPLLPFDGGHAAIATYERLRTRRGRTYRADVGKMVPVATAVVALLVTLLMVGLYLDVARPIG